MRNIWMTVEMQCFDCDGTGLMLDFQGSESVGIVCTECKGTGRQVLLYRPFTGRKKRDDIQIVRLVVKDNLDKTIGSKTEEITYQEFLEGKWPGLTEEEVNELVGDQQESEATRTKSAIDFELYEISLQDGTADDYIGRVHYLSAEVLLLEQGDERTWLELADSERELIAVLLQAYAERKGYEFDQGEEHCMVSMHK